MVGSQHVRDIAKLITGLAYRHQPYQVFADFLECSALALVNAVDLGQKPAREERYLQVIKRYEKAEVDKLPHLLGMLILALEEEITDVLGGVFNELELHNKYQGQFFTPQSLCDAMAAMTIDARLLSDRDFITIQEPACGSGAMVIGCAKHIRNCGFNYQQSMHVTAMDVDLKAVHMAYTQLTLLHIPAVIYHANTLSGEIWSRWVTPAHVLGFWDIKLDRQRHTMPPALKIERKQLLPEQQRGLTRKRLLPAEQRG